MFQKNTDMNISEIACFLALLMGLRSHETCNQENKYMEMCINICKYKIVHKYMQFIP